jgi:hypothetical protein
MLVHAILTDSARLCAAALARVEFAFRTGLHNGQPSPACEDALQKIGGTNADEIDEVDVKKKKVGRKRGFRDIGFPVAGPLGGAYAGGRNGTGPSRGKAREGYTSPIPAEVDGMRSAHLGRRPLVRIEADRRKSFMAVEGRVSRAYNNLRCRL